MIDMAMRDDDSFDIFRFFPHLFDISQDFIRVIRHPSIYQCQFIIVNDIAIPVHAVYSVYTPEQFP